AGVDAVVAQAQVRVPAEEAGRGGVAGVAHGRFQVQAAGVQGEGDFQVQRKRIPGMRVGGDGVAAKPHAGAGVVRVGGQQLEIGAFHEAVHDAALAHGGARLQVVVVAV